MNFSSIIPIKAKSLENTLTCIPAVVSKEVTKMAEGRAGNQFSLDIIECGRKLKRGFQIV